MFKNIKIGTRLALSFSIMLVLIIALIAVGLNSILKIHQNLHEIVTNENVRIEFANKMKGDVREVSISLRTILLDKSKTDQEDQLNRIDSLRKNYDSTLVDYMKLIPKDEKEILDRIAKLNVLSNESRASNNSVIANVKAGNYEVALNEMLKVARPKVRNWIETIVGLESLEKRSSLESFGIANSTYSNVKLYLFFLGGFSIVLAVIISVLLTLSITRPLNICVQTADRIALKDLTLDLNVNNKRNDEFGILIQSFSKMIGILREQIHEILEGVNVLASSSTEILASTTQIASGSSETAAAISETSTTVEEVRQAAQLSSQKAKNLSDSAQHVAQVSQGGQKSVEDTISGMSHIRDQMVTIEQAVVRLSEQSHSIGSIIASVTDIADQSNLLAVNAAIEAARAGEQGKGFSVVAQEIRNLAEQSKESTMQVRNILNDVQKATNEAVLATEQGNKAMETGVKQSLEAGEAIRILTGSINETAQVSTQIVASSQQQLVGMDQIGIAMQSINQAGIETAASMIQSEKSARNLNELGQKLKEMVERFKV